MCDEVSPIGQPRPSCMQTAYPHTSSLWSGKMSMCYTLAFQRQTKHPHTDRWSFPDRIRRRAFRRYTNIKTTHLTRLQTAWTNCHVRIDLTIPQGALRHCSRGKLIAKDAGPKVEAHANYERATRAIPKHCVKDKAPKTKKTTTCSDTR